MNSNRGHPHLSDCFIPSLNICPGNNKIKNVEVEKKRLKISFRSSPFHCQYSVMKNKTISHNWLALLFAHIDTGSPITEYPVRGKKTRLVFHGRFTRKKEISTTMPYFFFSFGADVLDLRISVKLHHYVPRHPSKVPRGLIEKQHV